MITSLSTEDNIQITNSLQQSSLILNNKIKHLVDNLNEILKYDSTGASQFCKKRVKRPVYSRL